VTSAGPPGAPASHPIHEGWTVRAVRGPVPSGVAGREVPATVPGCVHTDLLDAGLIADPFVDDNEALTRWVGLTDWEYRTAFAWVPDGHERQHLVFDGLDTVGEVRLNGDLLGEVDNMHRTWRFDVTGRLRAGANELVVAFRSPLDHAARRSLELGMLPNPYPSAPFHAIRKMVASFGWDWGLSTATSGLWRPVTLESWSTARLDRVLVEATPTPDGGRVRVRVRLDRTDDRPLTVGLVVAGAGAQASTSGTDVELDVEVAGVRRWWPRGYGEQPLYDASVTLADGEHLLGSVQRRVGFRSVAWDTTPDAHGTPFALRVNDQPVWVKGVNWIPDDAFLTRVDRARYRERLLQAVDANVNLVRVWGGGIFESDDFYELCDELGLLTWQDFLMACSAYSEDAALVASIEAESRDNLARIGHHASLVLLNGSNENVQGYQDWGWQRMLDGRPWGARYYDTLFPALVAELTPTIPYIPSSPFSPGGEPANAEVHGATHIWDLWNERDWLDFRAYRPRFVTEFGWQGPPAWTTLTDAVHGELAPESVLMEAHQKARWGNHKLLAGLLPHFPVPRTVDDWHWAMQLNQALAVLCAFGWFRSLAPHNSGAVIWQLNDCWPVISWATIDGAGRPKPAWYAMRDAFADRVVRVQPDGDDLQVVAGNDTAQPWTGTVRLRRLTYDGTVRAELFLAATVPARGTLRLRVASNLSVPADPADEVLVVEFDEAQDHWFFAEPRDSALRLPRWDVAVEPDGDDQLVRVTPDVLVRDAFAMVDRLAPAARVDTGLFTLLPGETAVLRVAGAGEFDAATIARPDVLRCANQLVAR